MSPAVSHLHEPVTPSIDEALRAETQKLTMRMFRGRLLFVPIMGVVVLIVYAFLEPVPWKLLWIGATTLVVLVMSAVEYWRVKRVAVCERTLVLNIVGSMLLQTSMIYVTGGIQSPLTPIYLVLAMAAGVSVRNRWHVVMVVAVPVVCLTFFAAGELGQWLPRATPSMFDIGEGFAHRPGAAWSRVVVLAVVMSVCALVGHTLRRAYEAVVRETLSTRDAALEALVSRNREIVSISRTIAHELKNPLSSIQGLAQLMRGRATPGSKDRERFEVMVREIGRMTRVLEDFRKFAKPLSDLALATTDLARVIHEVATLHEGSAARRHVRVITKLPEDLLVVCDALKIQQALINLVQNAIEASPPDTEVRVQAELTGPDEVRICVIDQGPGLDPSVSERLFVPGVTTKEHGSGIGLPVAASVAQQHGGTLRLENGPVRGCVATLTVPRNSLGPQENAA